MGHREPTFWHILESVNEDLNLNKEKFAKLLTVTQKCDSSSISDNDITKLVRNRGISKEHCYDNITISKIKKYNSVI